MIVAKYSLVEPANPDTIGTVDSNLLDSVAQHQTIKQNTIGGKYACIVLTASSSGHNKPSTVAERSKSAKGVSSEQERLSTQPDEVAIHIRAVPIALKAASWDGGSGGVDLWNAAVMR
jgi:hypothetical protein